MPLAFEFDAATALSRGERTYQEDAVVADFAKGADIGLVVLADGMGGHAAGDVASKIVVSEVYSELMFHKGDVASFEAAVRVRLYDAAMNANACLKDHVLSCPETRGMGATLVASVVLGSKLYWISIGDSPLFLFRDGVLKQLNEDHSMAPQIDFMVRSGLLAPEDGEKHPDRNTLTSVLAGSDVAKIDCPADPLVLQHDDILIVASDGLQFLSDAEIEAALRKAGTQQSTAIVDLLLRQVFELEDPELDNVSFSVVKVKQRCTEAAPSSEAMAPPDMRRVG